jgi:Flp pilus assembly pilin Flp
MKDSRKLLSGERGSNLTEYLVLAVLLVILVILVTGRGSVPSVGINTPRGGILGTLNGIVSALSKLFRESVQPFRSPIQLR